MIGAKTLAAIHVAKKQCGMDDDTYRDFLQREGGVRSARDLDDRGARRVLAAFDGLKPKDAPRNIRQDRRPIARKALALWLSLYNLDEVKSRHDKALDAFVTRVTGKAALRFCTNGEAGKVVEALKEWCGRVGFAPEGDALSYLLAEQRRRLRIDTADTVPGAHLQEHINTLGAEIRRLKLGSRHTAASSDTGGAT